MSTKPEQQLKVGDWWYLPDQDKLVRRDDQGQVIETADLDNLCQKALNYFLLNAGRLVTRDELLNDVWGVRDVSDGRISRVIRVLRVALGDNSKEPLYIETIPKRGFRFVAPVTVVEQPLPEPDSAEPGSDTPTPAVTLRFNPSQRWLIGVALSAILLLSVVLAWWYTQQDQPETVPFARIQSLSSMGGIELHAAVSPDGRYVVYSHSVDSERRYSLVLQDLQTMEKRVLKTEKNASLNGSVWGANQRVLYYQRLLLNKLCEIRKLEFSTNSFSVVSDTLVTECGKYGLAVKLQVTPDQKFLIYPNKSSRETNTVLTLFSLDTKSIQQLTSPPPTSFGDYSVSLSPDGKHLAFLRDVARTHAQVWLMSLNERDLKLAYESFGFYPPLISWSSDQKELLLANYDNSLISFNLSSQKLVTKSYTDNPIIEVQQISLDNYLVASGHFWHSSLWKVNNPLTNPGAYRQKVEVASGSDSFLQPNPNPDAPSALLSGRSGKRQLWFYYPDGRQKQVTDFVITDLNTHPVFSPDGKSLLVRTGAKLWLVQDTKPTQQLAAAVAITTKLSWSSDSKSVYYTAPYQGQSQVFKLNISSGESTLLSSELKHYEESPDGTYSVQLRHNQRSFELVKDGIVTQLNEIIEDELALNSIFLRGNSVYFYRKNDSNVFEVFRYDIASKTVQGTGVTQALKGQRFYVSHDEKFIYLDDGTKGDIDIGLVRIELPS